MSSGIADDGTPFNFKKTKPSSEEQLSDRSLYPFVFLVVSFDGKKFKKEKIKVRGESQKKTKKKTLGGFIFRNQL